MSEKSLVLTPGAVEGLLHVSAVATLLGACKLYVRLSVGINTYCDRMPPSRGARPCLPGETIIGSVTGERNLQGDPSEPLLAVLTLEMAGVA